MIDKLILIYKRIVIFLIIIYLLQSTMSYVLYRMFTPETMRDNLITGVTEKEVTDFKETKIADKVTEVVEPNKVNEISEVAKVIEPNKVNEIGEVPKATEIAEPPKTPEGVNNNKNQSGFSKIVKDVFYTIGGMIVESVTIVILEYIRDHIRDWFGNDTGYQNYPPRISSSQQVDLIVNRPDVPPYLAEQLVGDLNNSVVGPSYNGPKMYSDNEVVSIYKRLQREISAEMFQQGGTFRHNFGNQISFMCEFLHRHPQRDRFFASNYNDLLNMNHLVNTLIYDSVFDFALHGNQYYHDLGFAIFIEQIALLQGNHPSSYYDDPTAYSVLHHQFRERFQPFR